MRTRHRRLLLAVAVIALGAATWVLWPRDPGLDGRQSGGPHGGPSAEAESGGAITSAGAHAVERTPVATDTSIPVSAEATPSPTRLLGRVEHPDGEPVAAAEVTLLRRDADAFWNLDLAYAKQIDTVATARTDRDGRFAFDVARGVPYRLRAVAPDCAPALKTQCVGGQFVVLVAAPGATLVGTVRDKVDSAPIANASLRVISGGAELAAVEAARDGSFRIADLPAGQLTAQVSAPSYAESWKQVETRIGETATLEVALAHGDTLRGTVRDAVSQAPIGGARVAANWTMRGAVTTGNDGRYELGGVEHRDYTEIHVHASGYATAVQRPASDHPEVLDFALQRGGGVRGRVLDAAGRPLPTAYVAVGAEFATHENDGVYHTDWLRARVAADGTFAVDGLMPQHGYSLYARADGCGARAFELPRALPPNEWFDVGDVQLLAGAAIEGIVVDSADKPVAKIEVRLHGQNADHLRLAGDGATAREVSQFSLRDIETDSEGRFRFAGVAAGTYELTANARNLSKSVQAEPITVADGQLVEGLRLVFATGLTITGHFHQPPGLPTGARWTLLAHGQGQPSWAEVKTDGSFVFEHLEPGACTIHLFEAPEGWMMQPVHDIAAGRTDVELTPIATAFITGRVVDGDGKPARVSVYTRSDESPPFFKPTPTDADGRFKLAVLPGARVEVHTFVNGQPLSGTVVKDVLAGSDIEVKVATPGK